jgi:hypothetical protein
MGIVAVLVMLAAACDGGGNRPKPSDASTPVATAPSTTPSAPRTGPLTTGPGVQPGDKPPVLPDAAKQHTSTGALLFADYYFKAYDWGIATTDPYLVEQISAPSCTACQRYVKELNSLRLKGGHVDRGRTDVLSSKLANGTFKTKSDYVAECHIKEDAVVLVTPSAPPSTSAPASNYTSLIFVSWSGGRWQIVEEGAP